MIVEDSALTDAFSVKTTKYDVAGIYYNNNYPLKTFSPVYPWCQYRETTRVPLVFICWGSSNCKYRHSFALAVDISNAVRSCSGCRLQ